MEGPGGQGGEDHAEWRTATGSPQGFLGSSGQGGCPWPGWREHRGPWPLGESGLPQAPLQCPRVPVSL